MSRTYSEHGLVLCSTLGYDARYRYIRQQKEGRAMLTETQLRTAYKGELEDLRNRIEAELARRELAERETPEGRQVVEERPASTGTFTFGAMENSPAATLARWSPRSLTRRFRHEGRELLHTARGRADATVV